MVVSYREEYSLGPLVYREEKGLRSRLVCDGCGMRFTFREKEPSGEEATRLMEVTGTPSWGEWRLYGERFTVRVATYLKRRRRRERTQQWQQTVAIFPSGLKVEPGEYSVELNLDGIMLLKPIQAGLGQQDNR